MSCLTWLKMLFGTGILSDEFSRRDVKVVQRAEKRGERASVRTPSRADNMGGRK
jgi:hypothetical protein